MSRQPAISFVFLADTHSEADNGKLDAQGIFNRLNIWATPTKREFSLVIGFSDVPRGVHRYDLLVIQPDGEERPFGHFELSSDEFLPGVIRGERVPFIIESTGGYKIAIRRDNKIRISRYVRLQVAMRPWPTRPKGKELKRLLANKDVIKNVRAVLVCEKCKTEYIFQVNLDPDQPLPQGALPFPNDGVFRCPKCGHVHHLKDTEGQVLSVLGKPSR